MIRFKIFKNKILTRAKEQRFCKIGYARALKAQTFEELMEVIKDNFEWAATHKIIDERLIRKYKEEFYENGIFCNREVYEGLLLVTGNAKVVAHGDVYAGESGGYWKVFYTTKVYAYDNSKVIAYGRTFVKAFNRATIYAADSSTVYAEGDTTVYAYGNSEVFACDNSTVYTYGTAKVETFGNNVTVINNRPFLEPSNPTPEKEEKEPTELDIAEFLLHELVELLKKLGLFEKLAAYYREKHTNTHP